MSPHKRSQVYWFVALYLGSLAVYAMVVGADRGLLKLLH